MRLKENASSPRIEFRTSETEIEETPKLSAIALQQIADSIGLGEIASELEMEKHHGVCIEDIMLVVLLYSSYHVGSIDELAKKAESDKSLKSVIEDVEQINNKVILYFQNINEAETNERLLDRIISNIQGGGRFKSTKEGIIIFDDSPLIKTGKKMEQIEIIFDHVEKRYVLGYVLVATSYADKMKSYCINFEFRFSSEEDRKKAEQQRLKKKEEIDLRKKGSLIDWVDIQRKNGIEIPMVKVSGVNLNGGTLEALDEKSIGWLGLPSAKTAIFDLESNRLNFDALKRETLRRQPEILQIQGWKLYKKPVVIKEFGELVFCIVNDFQDNQLGCFLLKKAAMVVIVSIIQEFFTSQEPADNNKLNITLNLTRRAREAGIKATTGVGDSWFFVAWFIEEYLKIPGIKCFISKLKSNTEVLYKGRPMKVNDLWEKIDLEHIGGRTLKAGAAIVKVKGVGNPVKIVFVQELDKSGKPKARYILVGTDSTISKEKIIDFYKLRWSIECFFRAAKQTFGLDRFHVRKFNKIHSHVTFTFISYILLACLKIGNSRLGKYTFGQIIVHYLNSLVELEITDYSVRVYLNPSFEEEFGFPDGEIGIFTI